MTKPRKSWAALALAVPLLGAALRAQPAYLQPGSVLVYPVVDSRMGQGTGTVVSVTNTNQNRSVEPNTGYFLGTTQVRFYYATLSGAGWLLTDVPELLTPNDILTVLAGDHNPQAELGWLFVVAEDPETEALIDFDFLVGDEVLVNAATNRSVHYPAMAFRSLAEELNPASTARSRLGYWLTDDRANGGDGDGSADFNGVEYVHWPNRIYVSSFLELANLQTVTADLLLLSTLGADFRVGLRFLIYDNEEDQYSRTFTFNCWTQVPLQDISSIVRNLRGSTPGRTAPEELAVGWMHINGDAAVNPFSRVSIQDPPFAGAIVQRVVAVPTPFEFGHLLHHSGRNAFSHDLPPTPIRP